jgi:hypothetical protein
LITLQLNSEKANRNTVKLKPGLYIIYTNASCYVKLGKENVEAQKDAGTCFFACGSVFSKGTITVSEKDGYISAILMEPLPNAELRIESFQEYKDNRR